MVKEKWDDSTVFNYFDTTQFLFDVFKNNGENDMLLGSQLWNMAFSDLNEIVFREWNNYRNIVKKIRFTKTVNNKMYFFNFSSQILSQTQIWATKKPSISPCFRHFMKVYIYHGRGGRTIIEIKNI